VKAWVLARREWRSAFETPVAYVFLALFPAAAALFFFVLGGFFAQRSASLRGFFAVLPSLLIFAAPTVTMRLWSEERRGGTEELLRTYPFRVRDLVLGKFLAAFGLLAAALSLTAGVPLTVAWLGEPDPGPIWGGYLASLLLGAACVAVGLFFSACTRNQIVAWILGVMALVFFNGIHAAATATAVPTWLGRLLLELDFGTHFRSIVWGVVDLRDVLFYVAATVWFLCLNGLVLEQRRWP